MIHRKKSSRLKACGIIVSLIVAASSSARASGDSNDGEAFCYEMDHEINSLFNATETTCLPSNDKNGMTFLMLSSKPVFSSEPAKKAWLIVVAAAVGKTLNDHPKFKADSVIVSDFNLTKQRQGWRFPAKTAKSLQSKVYNGAMTLDAMYTDLLSKLTPFNVSAR